MPLNKLRRKTAKAAACSGKGPQIYCGSADLPCAAKQADRQENRSENACHVPPSSSQLLLLKNRKILLIQSILIN
jgi:hypothetical protein